MKIAALVLGGVLLAAAALVVLGSKPDREPAGGTLARPSPSEDGEPRAALPAAPSSTTVADPVPPVSRQAAGADDRTAGLLEQVTERSYAALGGTLVDYLIARGLERADGERIVRKGFEDAGRCFFESLRFEAEAQSVSFDSLLYALDAALNDADGPELAALIDLNAVSSRQVPCVTNVAQQIGIPLSFLEEASRGAARRRR